MLTASLSLALDISAKIYIKIGTLHQASRPEAIPGTEVVWPGTGTQEGPGTRGGAGQPECDEPLHPALC